ncbi:MAG: ATP-binding protein [Actinomycetota bacterium]|nr:ATP-binding protein [Actinomycetota bacterium]
MTTDDALAAWREDFLAEYPLDRDVLDDSLLCAQEAGIPDADRARAAEDRIPARYDHALATDPEVRAWLAGLAERAIRTRRVVPAITRGPSLLMLGPTGVGKTHQPYGMLRGMAALGIRAKWRCTAAADLYARLRPRHGVDSEAVFEEHARSALLVIDDLGAMKNSEWIEEVNYRLVNYRYEHELPTLFTSNLLPLDLANTMGGRVSSRLTEMSGRVTLKGDDRRYAA